VGRTSCLAGFDRDEVAAFATALEHLGFRLLPVVARLDVAEIARLAPSLLVCVVDRLAVDPLEMLRQLRFVLPACTIVVVTDDGRQAWARSCHLAGANGVLWKTSTQAQFALGVRRAERDGCFTDPRFADTTGAKPLAE
jgi:DNA-binding NarL/FixJ family response regulator